MLAAILGGILIGIGASLAWALERRVAGVSGILARLVAGERAGMSFRAAFVAGLLLGGAVLAAFGVGASSLPARPLPALAFAGVLVGFGTQLGGGCTSGHGVCGVSRLSPRSLLATATFVFTGMVTVLVLKKLAGAA